MHKQKLAYYNGFTHTILSIDQNKHPLVKYLSLYKINDQEHNQLLYLIQERLKSE